MVFDYLILIDLWPFKEYHPELNTNPEHYEGQVRMLLQNLNNFSFKETIITNGTIGDKPDSDRSSFYPHHLVEEWMKEREKKVYICGKYHSELFYTKDRSGYILDLLSSDKKILIGGTTWNICLHQRTLGFISLSNLGKQIYSSPKLCLAHHKHATPGGFTVPKLFENDEFVKWKVASEHPLIYQVERILNKSETTNECFSVIDRIKDIKLTY